jgi:hypothetical protein
MIDDLLVVSTYRNVPISYDPEKKQFVAPVGGREVRKPTQKAVESVILKYQGGGEPKRVMSIEDGYFNIQIQDLVAVGARGSKVLFRRPGRDELDREDGGHVYVFDENLFAQAKEMAKEREDWKKRWSALIGKMKRVNLEELR